MEGANDKEKARSFAKANSGPFPFYWRWKKKWFPMRRVSRY